MSRSNDTNETQDRVPLRDHFEDIFSPLDLANGRTVFRSEKCVGFALDRAVPTHVSDQKTVEPFKRYKRNKRDTKTCLWDFAPNSLVFATTNKNQQPEKTVLPPLAFKKKTVAATILVHMENPLTLVATRKVLTNTHPINSIRKLTKTVGV